MNNLTDCTKNFIFTFGYGNRKDYDALIHYIREFDITHVIDVRLKPQAWSRKWYADSIANLCDCQNIHYISRPSLGNTSGCSDWIPPEPMDAKETLLELSELLENENILLLCAELDCNRCHRTEVASRLQDLTKASVTHLT